MYENEPQVKPKHVAAFIAWGIVLLFGFSLLFLIMFPASAHAAAETTYYRYTLASSELDCNAGTHKWTLTFNTDVENQGILFMGSANPRSGFFDWHGFSPMYFDGYVISDPYGEEGAGFNGAFFDADFGSYSYFMGATFATSSGEHIIEFYNDEDFGCVDDVLFQMYVVNSTEGSFLNDADWAADFSREYQGDGQIGLTDCDGEMLIDFFRGKDETDTFTTTADQSQTDVIDFGGGTVDIVGASADLKGGGTVYTTWTPNSGFDFHAAFCVDVDDAISPPAPPGADIPEYATSSGVLWTANPVYCEFGEDCLIRVIYNDADFFDQLVVFYSGGAATSTPSPIWNYTDFFATSSEATTTTYFAYGYKDGVYIDGQVLTLIVFEATTTFPYVAWCDNVCDDTGTSTSNSLWDDVRDGLECAARSVACWAFNPHQESKNYVSSGFEHIKRSFPLNAYFDVYDAFTGMGDYATTSEEETLGVPMIGTDKEIYMLTVVSSSTFESVLGTSTYAMIQNGVLTFLWIIFVLYIMWRIQHRDL